MKIIISCSKSKNGDSFLHNGTAINFVSRVDGLGAENELYVHPDDLIPNEKNTWRDLVSQQEIRNELLPAYQLYKHSIYSSLFRHYSDDLFIFSAGWGIVKADFRLPKYNVTFSNGKNVPIYSKRNKNDLFNDFNHLEGIDENETIVLIASKDYVLPFCQQTNHLPNQKVIIYKNMGVLNHNPYANINNFRFKHYLTNERRKWHYEYANKLINNEIEL
jgi:hypothetical protein